MNLIGPCVLIIAVPLIPSVCKDCCGVIQHKYHSDTDGSYVYGIIWCLITGQFSNATCSLLRPSLPERLCKHMFQFQSEAQSQSELNKICIMQWSVCPSLHVQAMPCLLIPDAIHLGHFQRGPQHFCLWDVWLTFKGLFFYTCPNLLAHVSCVFQRLYVGKVKLWFYFYPCLTNKNTATNTGKYKCHRVVYFYPP